MKFEYVLKGTYYDTLMESICQNTVDIFATPEEAFTKMEECIEEDKHYPSDEVYDNYFVKVIRVE